MPEFENQRLKRSCGGRLALEARLDRVSERANRWAKVEVETGVAEARVRVSVECHEASKGRGGEYHPGQKQEV